MDLQNLRETLKSFSSNKNNLETTLTFPIWFTSLIVKNNALDDIRAYCKHNNIILVISEINDSCCEIEAQGLISTILEFSFFLEDIVDAYKLKEN